MKGINSSISIVSNVQTMAVRVLDKEKNSIGLI